MEPLSKKKKIKKTFKQKNQQKKADRKKPDKTKRGRLFIKNLPFKITEQEFKSHFEQFGDIVDVQLLKNADGKLKGCGFINYDKKISAVKAILKSNKKPFKDRTISVDWAVPKTTFEKAKKGTQAAEKKEEVKVPDDDDKDDDSSDDEIQVMENYNEEKEEKEEVEEDVKPEVTDESEEETSEEEEDDEEEEEEERDDEISIKEEDKKEEKRKRVKSNDVTEGKTVFLRNVPFHIKNDRLRQIMVSKYGPNIIYALVCMDPLTEHSKGTAFVKFKTTEEAEACINKGDLIIDGETVTLHAAMDKQQLNQKKEDKSKQFKDSRNLYLVKEGVVIAGCRAAEGVSVADMTKRIQLEQWKTQMLRNLHMFVSKTRLIVHNLPPEYDDNALRGVFKKHGPPKAVIREAKVMRNIRDLDEKGVGKSKEHGFVSYTTHEDALQALRSINNNPNIFSRAKRPIVAFSIENRAILNAKTKRMEKSREKNPIYREKYLNEHKNQEKGGRPTGKWGGDRKGNKKPEKQKYNVNQHKGKYKEKASGENAREFKGQVAAPTQNITFSKNHKLNKQLATHKIQMQKAKKDHRQQKRKQVSNVKTKDPIKTKPNTAKRSLGGDKQFSKLISSYKSKISSASESASGFKKWYDS